MIIINLNLLKHSGAFDLQFRMFVSAMIYSATHIIAHAITIMTASQLPISCQ